MTGKMRRRKLEKLKIFISIPMKGLSDEEIKKNFDDIKYSLRLKYEDQYEVEFLDSFVSEKCPAKNEPVWYLGKSLEVLADADIAYFAKGWNKAKGCRIENQAAYAYDITCIEVW